MSNLVLRPPTFSPAKAPEGFSTPSVEWLSETWHVTHSTLPMWKTKRNVRIAYTPLRATSDSHNKTRLDDRVTYQSLNSEKLHTIQGIDTAASTETNLGEWDWRGTGFLKIASSHWEILGWGDEGDGNKWVVTIFAKTMFTPAGVDVYSQRAGGLQEQTLQGIKTALASIKDESVNKMAAELFEVRIDGSRKD